MKAMSKQQLADRAGCSVTTLAKWCRPFRKELEAIGVNSNDKLLPPKAVLLIAERLSIDVD